MKECQCEECKRACTFKPGWFKPGEVEKVAEFLGLSVAQLFETRLMVDWWNAGVDSEVDIFLLSPAVTSESAGQEFPFNPKGRCTFFKDGLCEIHQVKPYECRVSMCGESREIARERHKEAAFAWKGHQDQIKALLGRDPEVAEPTSIFDAYSIFGGHDPWP
jgi:Fe-S-cluster containining protein